METDINEQYERIFGSIVHPNLFGPDDTDYLELRQMIIHSAKADYDVNYIPFKDINFYRYEQFKESSPAKHEQSNKLTPEKSKLISEIVSSLETKKVNPPVQAARPNIYHLRIDGLCNASGYFDQANGLFVIMRNSSFICKVSDKFASSPIGIARELFINTSCIKHQDCYIVKEDTICKSASAAASYLMGRISSSNCWKLETAKE